MSIFRRPDYQSDTTQFINQLKTAKPTVYVDAYRCNINPTKSSGRLTYRCTPNFYRFA